MFKWKAPTAYLFFFLITVTFAPLELMSEDRIHASVSHSIVTPDYNAKQYNSPISATFPLDSASLGGSFGLYYLMMNLVGLLSS